MIFEASFTLQSNSLWTVSSERLESPSILDSLIYPHSVCAETFSYQGCDFKHTELTDFVWNKFKPFTNYLP